MDVRALFGISILMSFVAFGSVTKFYVWPHLKMRERNQALLPLVVSHTSRFIGLSFLVPGVVSSSLPQAFAAPAAYGDLIAAMLAIAASITLFKRWPVAIVLVWLFNIWAPPIFFMLFSMDCS